MANLNDYVTWRGDLSFSAEPVNGVDALCFATMAYAKLPREAVGPTGMPFSAIPAGPVPPGTEGFAKMRLELLEKMCETARFGDTRVLYSVDQIDQRVGMQFAACCVDITPDIRVVCFRGTDATMVGWREDFCMSYECPVAAQTAAAAYLEGVARGNELRLVVVGHSKGGNLAAYAGAAADVPEDRILSVWSFDGPGFLEPMLASENYQRVMPKLRSVVPESSIVGRLMGHHVEQQVVKSDSVGIQQHNPFYWHIAPPSDFEYAKGTTVSSRIMNYSIDSWLVKAAPDQRRAAVDAIFTLTNVAGAESPSQIKRGIMRNLPKALKTLNGFDGETKRILGSLLIRAATLSTTGMIDRATGSTVGQAAENLIQRWIAKGDVPQE